MLAARVAVAIETALLYAGESLERAWLQNIIDQMPDGVLLYDEHGRLKAKNHAIAALTNEQAGRTDPYGNELLFARARLMATSSPSKRCQSSEPFEAKR